MPSMSLSNVLYTGRLTPFECEATMALVEESAQAV